MISVSSNIIANLVLQLGKLAAGEVKQLMGVEDEAESLAKELRLIKSFLRDSEGIQQNHNNQELKELFVQIKDVVFQAEDTIEMLVLQVEKQLRMNPLQRIFTNGPAYIYMLKQTANQIESLNGEIKRIYDMREVYRIEMGINGGGGGRTNPRLEELLRKRRMEVEEVEVVGFDDVADTLMKQITGGSRQLQIVSIVGMGGLGKTTVAKKLYNDRVIKDHFPNSRGWSFVSEDYNLRQVIIDLLKTMLRVKIRVSSKTKTDDLKQALKKSLQGRKYVVFLDDIWKAEMWDDICGCFPDDSKYGSRVVITTRDAKVAKHATRNPPYRLRKLDPKESWDLFCNKVFRGVPCPPNLIEIGQKIAQKCDGLPLAIVVLGSMLAVEEQTVARWTHMVDYVSSLVNEKQECAEILKLSYRHLPRQLKPCFLYFAAFPEDYEMNVRRLIAMWIAEGLIESDSQQPLVLVAERCLEMLIDRSLVQIGERRSDGGVKTCRIHDLLRDLCIKEARQENFLMTSTYLFSPSQGLANNLPRRVSSVHLHTLEIIKQGKVRNRGTTLPVRSLISFDKEGSLPETSWKVLTNNFKLLRVLDLGSSIWNFSVPDSISNLGNLRYLRLRILKSCFPSSSIFKLQNLQVLIIEGDYPFTLSNGLYKMHQLQRLVLRLPCTLSRHPSPLLIQKPMTALEVMGSVVPTEILEALVKGGMFPSITKLALTGTKDQKPWTLLPYLEHLARLQTLKIVRHSFINNDCLFQGVIKVPATLTKITLISSILTQNTLDVLSTVPNLQVLKVFSTVPGTASRLRFNQSKFYNLHTLHLKKAPDLKQLQIVKVEDTLPLLRHLLVRQCTNLWHISPELFQLPCLQVVEVLQANKKLAQKLHDLERENKVKCRLLVHTP